MHIDVVQAMENVRIVGVTPQVRADEHAGMHMFAELPLQAGAGQPGARRNEERPVLVMDERHRQEAVVLGALVARRHRRRYADVVLGLRRRAQRAGQAHDGRAPPCVLHCHSLGNRGAAQAACPNGAIVRAAF
ncbi:Uncharacterised protein [Bordetella pertussis]|nr:Uncharacterised protein [Bordetella pertussis]CFP66239.1 Uncharacterised protein [Bordetella pertussis]